MTADEERERLYKDRNKSGKNAQNDLFKLKIQRLAIYTLNMNFLSILKSIYKFIRVALNKKKKEKNSSTTPSSQYHYHYCYYHCAYHTLLSPHRHCILIIFLFNFFLLFFFNLNSFIPFSAYFSYFMPLLLLLLLQKVGTLQMKMNVNNFHFTIFHLLTIPSHPNMKITCVCLLLLLYNTRRLYEHYHYLFSVLLNLNVK